MREVMIDVDDGRGFPGGEILEVERRLLTSLFEQGANGFDGGLLEWRFLLSGAGEGKDVIEVRLRAAGGHGDYVNVRHAEILRLEAVIDAAQRQPGIVLDARKALLGNVGNDPAVNNQGGAAVVPTVHSENPAALHTRVANGSECAGIAQ